jgi:hypothetical protein
MQVNHLHSLFYSQEICRSSAPFFSFFYSLSNQFLYITSREKRQLLLVVFLVCQSTPTGNSRIVYTRKAKITSVCYHLQSNNEIWQWNEYDECMSDILYIYAFCRLS